MDCVGTGREKLREPTALKFTLLLRIRTSGIKGFGIVRAATTRQSGNQNKARDNG